MKVTIKKEVEFEIPAPSWWGNDNQILYVGMDKCISAMDSYIAIQPQMHAHQVGYIEDKELLPITEKEFWAKYEVFNKGIKEQCAKIITESTSAAK